MNYKLALSLSMYIHSVFHVSLLKSADSETLLQVKVSEIHSESQNAEFKIEKVLRWRVKKSQSQYLVKWIEYSTEENT